MSDKDSTSDAYATLQTGLQNTLREALHAELAHMDPDAGLAQLHARLRAASPQARTPAAQPTPWREALRGWFTRWPTALASLVIVLQAGLLAWQMQPPQQDVAWRGTEVETLGSSPTALLVVHFAPQAPLQAVTILLHSLRAEAIAGPDEDGLWTLAVPTTQRDAALAQLRASPLVQAATAP